MSLHPHVIEPVPEDTARVARAAFPKGHPSLTFRDALGIIFQDEDVAALFPASGQPGLPPWRLALVTLLPFRENLADRQAVEAVRARIDWTYLLSLELTDPGFDFSVLSECRDRLLAGSAETLLWDKLLARCRTMGLLKARGQQRTDSPHVLAAIRVMHRLELVAETLRAALNELATVAPAWLQGMAPLAWYERSGKRSEDTRLPQGQASRDAYAQMVGEDGFALLDALEAAATPAHLRAFPLSTTLRQTWQRHYEWASGEGTAHSHPARSRVRFKRNQSPRRRRSSPPTIRRHAIGRHATRSGPGTGCMSARRVRRPRPTCSRRCTRPPPPSMRPSARPPSIRPAARKTWRRGSIASMAPLSVRTCSSPAGMSTGSPCAAPRGRAKGGKRIPMGPMISPSSRSMGSSGRPAVRRARSRLSGGSTWIARASRILSCASASRIAALSGPAVVLADAGDGA